MDTFFYKEPYEENGKTVLEVNLFPDKYCNFNCIFCPVSRKLTCLLYTSPSPRDTR